MKKLLLLLAMILLPMVVSAYDIAVANADGVTIGYNYTNNGTELAVAAGVRYVGNVVIPEEVTYMNRTRKVTSIDYQAFNNCSKLTSITISNSVKSIGKEAFYGCKGLTSVTIGNSVTSIGKYAFYNCYSLTSVTIPNSVTSIGEEAFSGCYDLTSVTIGNSVTSIDWRAFYKCWSLKKVIVSDIAAWCGIVFYDSNPLSYAKHLYSDENTEIKDLVIPNSVTSIGNYAFCNCTGLTSITIPNSVTRIRMNSFSYCSSLTSIIIGSGIKSIESKAFAYCSELTDVYCYAENVPSTNNDTFSESYIDYATLHVPTTSIDAYKAKEPWKNFKSIVAADGEIPETKKCEKPTIGYVNGKLTFACSTESATCQYSITDSDIKAGSGNEVQLSVTYNISVYATKEGYENSETANATLCWIDQQPKAEGDINGIANITAKALLIKNNGGQLTVEGAADGEAISVYTVNGVKNGSAISQNGAASIDTNLQAGSIAIVKIGDKSVKVVIK